MNFRFFFATMLQRSRKTASNFSFFLRIFYEILSGFRDRFQKRVTCVAFHSNLRKQIRKLLKFEFLKFVKILKFILFNIIQYYSILFIRVLTPTPSSVDGSAQQRSKVRVSSQHSMAPLGDLPPDRARDPPVCEPLVLSTGTGSVDDDESSAQD